MTDIKVDIIKSKIPLVWIDTSIISNIAYNNLKGQIKDKR